MTRRACGAALLAITIASTAEGQAALGSAVQNIRTAMTAGNHETSVRIADSLVSVFPGHPSIVLLRAQTLASAGRWDAAERDVRTLLSWDARYARRALQDSLMAPLRMRLEPIVTPLAQRADSAYGLGNVVATIEERDLVPEGTAWDPATRSILIGSLNKRAIIAIGPDGTISDRVPRGGNGLGSVVGIHVDSARGVLWATSNARFDVPSDTMRSALYAFDAGSGRFRARYDLPAGSGPSFLNDLTTGPDGTVYVTDSRAGAIWVLRSGAATLTRFEAAGEITAPNGITASADGRHLFISDMDHIRVVPLRGGTPWNLVVPDSINVTGIDGLAFASGGLIAHHPLSYWRVVYLAIDPGYRRITSRVVIENNTSDSRTSTTGEVAGDRYIYIGNSQIDRMNAGTINATSMDPIRIYGIPLRALSPARD